MSEETKNPGPKPRADRASAAFRRDLLRGLPEVAASSSTISTMIDVAEDLGAIMELDGDAVLAPLQAAGAGTRGK